MQEKLPVNYRDEEVKVTAVCQSEQTDHYEAILLYFAKINKGRYCNTELTPRKPSYYDPMNMHVCFVINTCVCTFLARFFRNSDNKLTTKLFSEFMQIVGAIRTECDNSIVDLTYCVCFALHENSITNESLILGQISLVN